jgi:hypothetical protein
MTEREKISEAALRLLDFKDRTSEELKNRLIKKGFEEGAVHEVILRLEESGILDDKRYAALYTQSKLDSGKGSRWIRQKLLEKGISRETADMAIEEIEDESVLCTIKALSICGLAERYEVDSDGEIIPLSEYYEKEDYFGRKIPDGETDRNIMRKEREKAKNSLTRRLITAGFPPGTVFDTVRKIEKL